MKKEYFCAGRVVLEGMKKGVSYIPMKKGKVDEEAKALNFLANRNNDNPVGWVVSIEYLGKDKYQGFDYVRDYEDEEVVNKFRVEHISNCKRIDLERLRKRKKSISNQIENMTMAQIKEYVKRSHANKQAVQFYLMEVF